jgi:hypothetical protein
VRGARAEQAHFDASMKPLMYEAHLRDGWDVGWDPEAQQPPSVPNCEWSEIMVGSVPPSRAIYYDRADDRSYTLAAVHSESHCRGHGASRARGEAHRRARTAGRDFRCGVESPPTRRAFAVGITFGFGFWVGSSATAH